MYCPKCKEKFEQGSRRFCPTDGSRLLSESSGDQRGGGVFANLIPKMDAISDLGERKSAVSEFVVVEPAAFQPPAVTDDAFFELEIDSPERDPDIEFPKPTLSTPVSHAGQDDRPVARKVNPYEIPAGHVDLGDAYRSPAFSADFDEEDPQSFVGRIVKGRYLVTEFLGGDETGLAFLGDDKIVNDKKVLVRILLGDEFDEIMDSIIAEERVSLAHFSHPNIARLIDSGQFTNGTDFLVSEYVDALSVDDILAIHGQFGELRAARVIRQIASALNEAHQEGILHRDIRPQNLIIDSSAGDAEQAKLVNFGSSNGVPNSHNIGYKAPEVLGERIPTVSSDIFSLAVVAYEMLTGRLPFDGNTAKEIGRAQSSGLKVHPSDVRPELPKAVDEIFDKALAYNAADRFPKARDFGDAFYAALTELRQRVAAKNETVPVAVPKPVEVLTPAADSVIEPESPATVPVMAPVVIPPTQPLWKNRSPEPPEVGNSKAKWIAAASLLALIAVLFFGWSYIMKHPTEPEIPAQTGVVPPGNTDANIAAGVANTEMPPQPRNIAQPANTNFYQNSKQNLKGDLLLNFVGFTMYYPKEWKVNGPKEGSTPNTRGKFIDISRSTPDDKLKEQMLISYYPSKGTYASDAEKFPQMVKETNETLKKLLPGYKMVSEGEIKFNGEWRAYEVKFKAGGKSATGENLEVWGRRLFIPAARPGVRNGFEITMLATSLADNILGPDDVGVKGELAGILYSFEPSQNF